MNYRFVVFAALVLCACLPAQTVPTGFVVEPIWQGGGSPNGVALLPDGRVLWTEKTTGRVYVARDGQRAITLTVPNVTPESDRGLSGIAIDPEWPTWPYIYLHYTHTSGTVRITRYTGTGELKNPESFDLTFGSPYDILVDIPDNHPWHNGGSVRFGPDGMLYASFGDDSNPCAAQDTTNLLGTIVRLDVGTLRGATGSGPPPKAQLAASGHPFNGEDGQLIHAFGLRNAFRFSIDPATAHIFAGDVGSIVAEEVNEIRLPGENFGWPFEEGPQSLSPTCPTILQAPRRPAVHYLNLGGAAVIIFGGVYRNLPAPFAWGSSYEGNLLVTDFVQGFVRRYIFDGASWNPAPPVAGQPNATDWGAGFNGITDAILGHDGAIYLTKVGAQRGVFRVRPEIHMSWVDGPRMAGNAGTPLPKPLAVRVAEFTGTPIPGQPVTFRVVVGDGTFAHETVMTDSGGVASTPLVLGTRQNVDLMVEASTTFAPKISTSITWRGLTFAHNAVTRTAKIGLIHSETNSPFTLAFDDTSANGPYLDTPAGAVWTRILNPAPSVFALDGLGLLGVPETTYRTGPVAPIWSLTLTNLPVLDGVSLTMQAYAVDSNKEFDFDGLLISQPVRFKLN